MYGDLILIGTYTMPIRFGTGQVLQGKGEGIYALRLDRRTGRLSPEAAFKGIDNPSYLCRGGDASRLYAVNELKEFRGEATGALSSFRFDPEALTLKLLSQHPTGGTDPCHVVTGAGDSVYVANFMSGSIAVFRTDADGAARLRSQFFQYEGHSVNPARQSSPHAHSVIFDRSGRRAFVPDLGTDRLMRYEVDGETGELTEAGFFALDPGTGPRHCAFSQDGRYCYLIKELTSEIAALSYDGETGEFRHLQTVSTVSGDFAGHNSCADIDLSLDGRFLYGSNRGENTIACFRIDQNTGLMQAEGRFSSGGEIPRSFAVDPLGEFLLAANQDTGNVVVFRIDRGSGALIHTSESAVPTPVCVKFWH
ncbi:MAG: lactonase family protein [Clostridiales bacterium]|nr:lactonase family protein [Clostridiales bacterium]